MQEGGGIGNADGPGQLLGFVYGPRQLADVDRWGHGRAENIYIDGEDVQPVYLRGIGGEDAFGAGCDGALHPPERRHYAAMPCYGREYMGAAGGMRVGFARNTLTDVEAKGTDDAFVDHRSRQSP